MKKGDIIILMRRGVAAATNHCLPAELAIKVVLLRRFVNDAYYQIVKDEDACREAAEIKDALAFDKERDALLLKNPRTEQEQARLAEMDAQLGRFQELKREMLKQDVPAPDISPMSYEQWHALQRENAAKEIGDNKVDILSGRVEDLLEGILWEFPIAAKKEV